MEWGCVLPEKQNQIAVVGRYFTSPPLIANRYKFKGLPMGFPLDEKFIVECEQELDAKLPTSYRAAMMANNGGQIETVEDDWDLYPVFDKSDRKRIARTCNHIIAETVSCKNWRGFPENALAIAGNGMGDQMVFLNSNNKFDGKVYFWSHETGDLSLLVNDFSELNRL